MGGEGGGWKVWGHQENVTSAVGDQSEDKGRRDDERDENMEREGRRRRRWGGGGGGAKEG